jgi:sec-independent protein translocase protein TatB
MFSIQHMIIIFIVVLVVFGPQKLPELARGLGKLMAEFRKASGDFRNAFEQEMRDLDRQAMLAERKKQAEATVASPVTPATLAVAEGTEAAPAEAPSADNARLTEAPVITTVAEAVPRSSEEVTATSETAATVPEPPEGPTTDGLHDAESRRDAAHDLQRPG